LGWTVSQLQAEENRSSKSARGSGSGCQPSPENTGISENLNPGSPEDLSTRIDHHQGVETLDRLFPNQTAQPNSMITE
jgi:hypothetical protein